MSFFDNGYIFDFWGTLKKIDASVEKILDLDRHRATIFVFCQK